MWEWGTYKNVKSQMDEESIKMNKCCENEKSVMNVRMRNLWEWGTFVKMRNFFDGRRICDKWGICKDGYFLDDWWLSTSDNHIW